ncbi:MAG: hypothetical protein R6V85_14045 [Polyangia bacterium]
MARKKIKSEKPRRKDDLDPNKDEFITRSMSYLDWAVERRRQIGAVLGLALLVAVVAILVNHFVESSRAESSLLLAEVTSGSLAPVTPDGPPAGLEEQGEEDVSLWFESRKERAEETLKRFEKVAEESGGTVFSTMGRLGAAAAHLDAGENEEAIAEYEKFLEGAGPELAWLRPNALEGLGHALEAAGKLEEARERFAQLAEESEGRVSLEARYHQARIAYLLEDRAEATELLGEVMDELVEKGDYDRLDYLFVQTGGLLETLDPEAEVPSLPGGRMGGLDNIDPETLERLIEMQKQAGGGGK